MFLLFFFVFLLFLCGLDVMIGAGRAFFLSD